MRSPSEIGPDFLRTFWTRKIHPELYLLEMEGFGLNIQQAGGARAPLEISFFSQGYFLVVPLANNRVQINFFSVGMKSDRITRKGMN